MTRFLKKKKTVPYIVKNMIVAVKYSHTKNTGNGRKPSKNKRIWTAEITLHELLY